MSKTLLKVQAMVAEAKALLEANPSVAVTVDRPAFLGGPYTERVLTVKGMEAYEMAYEANKLVKRYKLTLTTEEAKFLRMYGN